jgi:exonuclease SbcC
MITRVKLQNWKSHLDSDMSFSPGVNALIGIMGSGKSSVMQAISFGLYGTFSGLSSRRVAISDLIMKKPHEKDVASVEIEFSANGKTYSVSRMISLKKGTASAEIREDGKLLEVNPAAVTAQVERILQMDYDLFSRAVYSEQNGLDYFLNIPKGKRTQQIDDMLKLDRFERAREAAVSIRNRVTIMREERLKTIVEMRSKNIPERIELLEKEIRIKEDEKTLLQKEVKSAKERLSSSHSELEKETLGLRKLRDSVSELNGRIIFLNNQNRDMRSRKEAAAKQEEALSTLVKDLGEHPEKRMEELRKGIDGMKRDLHTKEALISELRKGLAELDESGERCPVCDSALPPERKAEIKKHRDSHMAGLKNEIMDLEIMLTKKEEERIELDERLDRMKELKAALKHTEDFESKTTANEKETVELRAKVAVVVGDISLAEGREAGKRKEYQELYARQRELETRSSGIDEVIEEKMSVLEDLADQQRMLARYSEETESYRSIADSIESFIGVLKITQDQLRDEFLKTVNSIMEQVWAELYPYGDFTGVRLHIDDDYVLQLRGSRDWVSVDIVSGGERSLACLALRVAFSLAFTPNLRWLILDEPTHNLDSSAIDHFGNVLKDRLGNLIDQVFLITHEERLSDYITGSLYRFERNKELDGVTNAVAV